MISKEEALDYHAQPVPGKIAIALTKPAETARDLALAYSPGVAEPVRESPKCGFFVEQDRDDSAHGNADGGRTKHQEGADCEHQEGGDLGRDPVIGRVEDIRLWIVAEITRVGAGRLAVVTVVAAATVVWIARLHRPARSAAGPRSGDDECGAEHRSVDARSRTRG